MVVLLARSSFAVLFFCDKNLSNEESTMGCFIREISVTLLSEVDAVNRALLGVLWFGKLLSLDGMEVGIWRGIFRHDVSGLRCSARKLDATASRDKDTNVLHCFMSLRSNPSFVAACPRTKKQLRGVMDSGWWRFACVGVQLGVTSATENGSFLET